MPKSPHWSPLQQRWIDKVAEDIAMVKSDGRWTDRKRDEHWTHMSRYHAGLAESDPAWAPLYRHLVTMYDEACALLVTTREEGK